MTADKPQHHTGSTSPKSPRSPIRSHSLTSPQNQPYKQHSMTIPGSPSSSIHKPHTKPMGPRSPEQHKSPQTHAREQPGSSRTKFHTVPILSEHANKMDDEAFLSTSQPLSNSPPSLLLQHDAPHAPYRPPEAVIEPPEEHPPGYAPGIVAEHVGSDDDLGPPPDSPSSLLRASQSTLGDHKQSTAIDTWKADIKPYSMDIDSPSDDDQPRPQVGPGILPRRLLMVIHEHELIQPHITELPQPGKKVSTPAGTTQSAWNGSNKTLTAPTSRPTSIASASGLPAPPSPAPSTASFRSLPDSEKISSLDDVWDSLPGKKESHLEWYFCTTCWGWLKIIAGNGEPSDILSMEEWEETIHKNGIHESKEEYDKVYNDRLIEWQKYNEVKTSRLMAEETHDHFHGFFTLIDPLEEKRIERVEVDDKMNVFPHITFGMIDEEGPNLSSFDKVPKSPTRLFISCSSDLWVKVDQGLVPGQLPIGLVNTFTSEKMSNPTMGTTGSQGVSDAWSLITTLLLNPVFKGQRGWVKLDNPKFQRQIGASVTSSRLLYQIGFACQQEEDGLRVGPFKVNDEPSEEDQSKQRQMDQYMIRAWVEITLYLLAYQQRNNISPPPNSVPYIQAVTFEDSLKRTIDFDRYPKGNMPYGDLVRNALFTLGVTKLDRAQTIEIAYGLQISCDSKRTPEYLAALEKVAEAPIAGRESLQMRVATERSLDKYSSDDLEKAYNLIGYTSDYAETLCVLPSEAPDSHIFDLHKKAVQSSSSASERQNLSNALLLIGRERGSDVMKQLGESGQTLMSVQEAYSALNCPEDAIDDGLLMQYEMAVNEYPGKADHYRNCLTIIAEAPGQERPGIKSFLQTGSREPEAPPRKDIPVGLHNIGYLNSILQYLYSIKPLRDAVISFEQDQSRPITTQKPDVERSKRFVRQLRLLFLQLYKSEIPSVRPDEELAYLAITRPEVDAIVEPQVAVPQASTSRFTLDDIPDIPDVPSPSSTQVNTPVSSPELKAVDHPVVHESSTSTLRGDREDSVLGKRASEDRDDSPRSSAEHIRYKSDESQKQEPVTSPMEIDDFESVPRPDAELQQQPSQAPSPSATMDLGHLDLKSPVPESKDEFIGNEDLQKASEPEIKYDPPNAPPPLPPRPQLAKKDTLNSGLRFGLQQDSAEVLINVLSQLELALDLPSGKDGEKGSNLIQSLFSCKYKQQIIYETPAQPRSPIASSSTSPLARRRESIMYDAQTPVESVFVHPIIGVEEEGKDLSDCLAELYLKGADIEYEGKKGYMMDLMDEFPDMLYIQMRRSQYDPATGRERKTNTHIPFDRNLSMGRFLIGADPLKREEAIELTREMTRIRARLHQLRNHKPLSIPETFKHVSSSLKQLTQSDIELPELSQDLTHDFFDALESKSASVESEITALQESLPNLKQRMNEIWHDSNDDWEYELVSVFMHRGKSSGSGHYWTYQSWLPDNGDTFFKYNDETVTQVPSTEVLQDRTGDDANPALLCYVRKGKNLIDTLHREILKLQVQQEQEAVDQPIIEDNFASTKQENKVVEKEEKGQNEMNLIDL
ncbi:uncharacterized protein L201_004378 [Kwoniella dendrophila CBS 6074]|uniref:ubiquitinyl hydrolase 1 n=1 Tax=Kwoniella dendrophila CBS 6074 TaxID=1295534 RepID=A0AAX4JXB2_9TREE